MSPSRYAQAAFEREVQRVREAAPGGRAEAVYRAGRALGQLVGGGLLERDAVEATLLDAAQAVGLSTKDARSNVVRGIRRGEQKPRSAPEPDAKWSDTRVSPSPAAPRTADSRDGPPPADEVEALWAACVPVAEDAAVVAYLASRGLASEQIDLWSLARALPSDVRLPWWASRQRMPWWMTNHRLIVRAWNAQGCLASVRARCIAVGTDQLKELAPAGHRAAGLVLADPMAVQVLRGQVPSWWTTAFVISEGTPDWLTWASLQSDASEQGAAYFGISAGSWTPEIAARLPGGARVVIRTHHDQAGHGFAKQVFDALKGRCQVLRA